MDRACDVSYQALLAKFPDYASTLACLKKSVTETLTALHEAGVAHGDIRPENIIVRPQQIASGILTPPLEHEQSPKQEKEKCRVGEDRYVLYDF